MTAGRTPGGVALALAALLAVACGDGGRAWPVGADTEPPWVRRARLEPRDDGGLDVVLEIDDDGECGVAAAGVLLGGSAMGALSHSLTLRPEGPGQWRGTVPGRRCGPTLGEARLQFISVRDGGGNTREYRKLLDEAVLAATDRYLELPVEPAPVGASAPPPVVRSVGTTDDGTAVLVEHDVPGCDLTGAVILRSADGAHVRLEPDRSRTGPRSLVFPVADPACMGDGDWTVESVRLQDAGGYGVLVEDPGGSGGPVVVRPGGFGARRSLALVGVDLTPARATGGLPVRVDVRAGFDTDRGCAPRRVTGWLRLLPSRDGVRRVVEVSEDGVAVLPACAPPGSWWAAELFATDVSGGRRSYALEPEAPEAGFMPPLPAVPSGLVELLRRAAP